MTNEDFRATFDVLAQDMMSQANREVAVFMNPNRGTVTSRVRDFTRLNSLDFMVPRLSNKLKNLFIKFTMWG